VRNKSADADLALARVAARQHGVVTLAQLRAAGIDRFGAARRAKAGRLHRLHRGVYAVGHANLSFEGRCLAVVFACGDGAVVSHLSAARVWGLLAAGSWPIEVTVPTASGRCKRPGHRLPAPEVNARVGRYEVDFLWRDLRLVVETDGYRYHSSRTAFEADRARDAQLQASGHRVLRFTYRQLRESPDAVVASLRSVLRAR
jgi:hypothetical protein